MKKSRKRSDGLETIERVLKVATAELERHGSTDFNLDRVIEKSEVHEVRFITTLGIELASLLRLKRKMQSVVSWLKCN